MRKVRASTASKPSTTASILWPIESRAPQRFSEAMQSSAVTGWPLLHLLSRRVKVQVRWSGEMSQVSTICGLASNLSSSANSTSHTM